MLDKMINFLPFWHGWDIEYEEGGISCDKVLKLTTVSEFESVAICGLPQYPTITIVTINDIAMIIS